MEFYINNQLLLTATSEKGNFQFLLPSMSNIDEAIKASQMFLDRLIKVKEEHIENENKKQAELIVEGED